MTDTSAVPPDAPVTPPPVSNASYAVPPNPAAEPAPAVDPAAPVEPGYDAAPHDLAMTEEDASSFMRDLIALEVDLRAAGSSVLEVVKSAAKAIHGITL